MVVHPLAERDAPVPGAVTAPDGTTYAVAADGTVDCPGDVGDALRTAWADRYDGYDPAPAADTCDAVTTDGEVCGRERPCQYHD